MIRALALSLFLSALYAQPLLLVLQKGSSSLGFYSLSGEKLSETAVGRHPHEMVLSADRRFLYCTDNGTMLIEQAGTGGNTVSIVDLRTRQRVGQIDLGKYRRPHGIDLDAATGNLLISTELPDRLLLADPTSRKVIRTYETKGKTSHIVTLGRGGTFAYVSNAGSANVAAIELKNGAVTLISTPERPEGSVLSPDGKFLYVACRVGNRIAIIDTTGNKLAGTIATGKEPVRLGRTADGKRLVWALHGDNGVEIADPAARKVITRVPVGGKAVSLNLSADGKVAYAAAQYDDTVYGVSVDEGRIVREFKTATGTGPDPVMEWTGK